MHRKYVKLLKIEDNLYGDRTRLIVNQRLPESFSYKVNEKNTINSAFTNTDQKQQNERTTKRNSRKMLSCARTNATRARHDQYNVQFVQVVHGANVYIYTYVTCVFVRVYKHRSLKRIIYIMIELMIITYIQPNLESLRFTFNSNCN